MTDYFQEHRKEFVTPEKVSVNFIRLSMSDVRGRIKISDEDIQHYYDEK